MLRDGKKYTTTVDKLVIGDIVDIKFGDRIPADVRIVKSAGFKVRALGHCLLDNYNIFSHYGINLDILCLRIL